MTYAFTRSKIAAGLVLALTAVIIVLVWIRGASGPVYIPIVASILMGGIGYFASRLAANVLSSMENTRYLGYLHMELDPEKFLHYYESVPDHVKGDRTAVLSYLADGYWAAGRFDDAIAAMEKQLPEEISLLGLSASRLACYYLAKGDKAEARHQLERLRAVVEKVRTSNPALSSNLGETLALYQQHLNALNLQSVEEDYLKTAFSKAQYNIRRLEITQVLALDALRRHDSAKAKEHHSYLTEHGGKTFYVSWAKEKLEELSSF